MHRQFTTALYAGMAIALSLPAAADIIFDNGHNSNFASASDFDFPHQVADDFQLQPDHVTITDVHWWGIYLGEDTVVTADDFTIRIFADDAGGPADIAIHEISGLDVDRTPTAGMIASSSEYAYSVDIAPIVLSANTTYWLSIINNTEGESFNWYWSDAGSGNTYRRDEDTDSWITFAGVNNLSFFLTGPGAVVPEPASMTLLGLGLAGVALGMRRKS